jgi:hypothetical protein
MTENQTKPGAAGAWDPELRGLEIVDAAELEPRPHDGADGVAQVENEESDSFGEEEPGSDALTGEQERRYNALWTIYDPQEPANEATLSASSYDAWTRTNKSGQPTQGRRNSTRRSWSSTPRSYNTTTQGCSRPKTASWILL